MIILNECEYAEKVLRDKEFEGKPFTTLSILGKYYYHKLGYKKAKIAEELTTFLEETYPRYGENKKSWANTIEKIATDCKKYELYEIEGVWVTKGEMAKIRELGDEPLERLMFTLVCMAKLAIRKRSTANGWVNEQHKNIFSLARVSGTKSQKNMMLNKLIGLGYIELPMKNDNLSIRVAILDESENELFIRDFRELGYEYLNYIGQNFIRCAECGILTRGNKNGTKRYCTSCGSYSPIKEKCITCIDCGVKIVINSRNNKTCRCDECQEIESRRLSTERVRRYRSKNALQHE